MKYFTRVEEVQAEQLTIETIKITLVDLEATTNPDIFYIREADVHVRTGEWIVKFEDKRILIYSDGNFARRFVGHNECSSLKESYDRLLWMSGGVSSAIMGHIKDGEYTGKPIAMIEEALDLRQRVETAEQLILSLGGVIANFRKARDEFIAKQGK